MNQEEQQTDSLFDFLWGVCPNGPQKGSTFLAISCRGKKILPSSLGPFSLEELEAQWKQLDGFGVQRVDDLIVDGDDRDQNQSITDDEWDELCTMIHKRCPSLRSLRLAGVSVMSDQRWAKLLRKMPVSLSRLVISGIGGSVPLLFETIGGLKGLEHLSLTNWCDENYAQQQGMASWLPYNHVWCKPESFCKLAESLKCLPLLKSITISSATLCHPQACWEPVAEAIRTNPMLEQVTVEQEHQAYLLDPSNKSGLSDWTLANYEPWEIPSDDLEALQTGPRITHAQRQYQLPQEYHKKAAKHWVEAMISVQDHLECFHYFWAKIPPQEYFHNPLCWEEWQSKLA